MSRTREEEREILKGWDSLQKAIVEAEVLLREGNAQPVPLKRALQKVVTFYNLENGAQRQPAGS